MNNIRSSFLILMILLCQSIFSLAQPSENISLLSQWNPSGNVYNDLWGYVDENNNEYALITSLSNIYITNITTANEVNLIDKFELGSISALRDVKTYDRYIYTVAGSGNEGLQVFDMSALPGGSVIKAHQNNTAFASCTNIFIDHINARLYAAGTNTRNNGLIIFDISSPTLPTVLASVPLSGGKVENLFVKDHIAYCAHGNSGVGMYDLSVATSPTVIASANTNGHTNACWLSDTGKFMVYTENAPAGQALGIIYIDEVGGGILPVISTFHAPLLAPTHTNNIPSNIYIINDYVFTAYHEDGVVVFDTRNIPNPTRVAYFDTSNNTSYNGALGCIEVYPFLPSNRVLALDKQRGLYILSTNLQINTTCNNGNQDGNETGIDCGGFCMPCAMPSCDDGIQNGTETGVDCGGDCLPCCPPEGTPCDDGNPETENDTADGNCGCIGISIAAYSCDDGIQNGDEAGIDCGGNACPACPVCASDAVNSYYEYIDKVVFNGIVNRSGNDGGYGDYTHLFTSVEAGETYPISLFTGYSGTPSKEFWQVWIDLNFDGDFDDAEELLFEKNGIGSVAGEVTIPEPQGGIFPIMRVQMQHSQYTNDGCKEFYYGEVEDYQLVILTGNTLCDDGIQNGDETGVDCGGLLCEPCCPLAGTVCDDGNPDTRNDVEDGHCNCIGAACPPAGTPCEDGNPNTLNDLTDNQCNCNSVPCPPAGTSCNDGNANTDNDATDGLCGCLGRLISTCADDIQNGDETGIDCGGECQPCFYCDSYSIYSGLEYIKKVIFNGINNPSGNSDEYAGGYENYTNISTEVMQGMTYQIQLTPGFTNGETYKEYWRVWIDYTQDGDFLDAGEMVYQGSSSTTLTGNISLPASAPIGQTRMRVQMNLNGYPPTGCDIYTSGEVEDYTLIINRQNNLKINNINIENVRVTPNPFQDRLTLAYHINGDMPRKGNVYLHDMWGRKIMTQEFVPMQEGQLSFHLNDRPTGTYFLQLVIGDYTAVFKVVRVTSSE